MTITYEIDTTVRKSFYHKTLRAYVFEAVLVIDGVKYPYRDNIPADKVWTEQELKVAIIKRMDAVVARYQKKLARADEEPEKRPVKVEADAVFKDNLSAKVLPL